MIGIYKITNPNKESYIGQATDWDIRKSDYKNLRCKNQPKIYKSLLKFGFEKHKFKLIKKCSVKELSNLEEFYKRKFIKKFGWKKALFCQLRDGRGGYRSKETKQKISKAKLGVKFSEETKRKISKSKKGCKVWSKGKKFSKQHCNRIKKAKKNIEVWWTRGKPILQKDLSGKLIKEWNYVSEASKFYNKPPNLIHKCCVTNKKKKLKKSKSIGFIWEFKNKNNGRTKRKIS